MKCTEVNDILNAKDILSFKTGCLSEIQILTTILIKIVESTEAMGGNDNTLLSLKTGYLEKNKYDTPQNKYDTPFVITQQMLLCKNI